LFSRFPGRVMSMAGRLAERYTAMAAEVMKMVPSVGL
jgi:hypothetical protein